MSAKISFRCKTCGHLEPATHAGDQTVPHACSVCGCGVRFGGDHAAFAAALRAAKTDAEIKSLCDAHSRQGTIKTLVPDNWEVLADAKPERLKELGLTAAEVERHVPANLSEPTLGRHIAANAVDGTGVKDKAN